MATTKGRRPRTKKFQNKKDELEDFSDSREIKKKGRRSTNDEKWYANNPQLLADAASYPFSQPVGRRWESHSNTVTKYETIPGVLALRCRPCFGFGGRVNIANGAVTADVNNPINVAANELYSWVRHKNSGAKNYEASDLMIYICAMSQVYSYITWAMRIYGMARMYEQRNRYMPIALCEANGVNFDSIKDNLANYRYGLNVLINKAASLKVPARIPLFEREAFMYMNIYTEGPSVKDQLYMYVPDTFLEFSLDSSGAGQLVNSIQVPQGGTTPLWTYQDILTTGNNMFQAIWDEEDFGTMSGDIEKAFEGDVLTLNVLNEDYGLIPIQDEVVLTQMKNTRILHPFVNTALHQVPSSSYTSLLVPLQYMAYESALTTVNDKYVYSVMDFASKEKALTINSVNPDPGLVIESTRMLSSVDEVVTMPDANNVNHDVVFITACTEICVKAQYVYIDAGTNVITFQDRQGTLLNLESSLNLARLQTNQLLAMLNKHFKYSPEMAIYNASTSGEQTPSTWNYWSLFEVDNYTTVGPEEIKKLHEAAMLSLLHVNSIGSNAKA